MLHAKDRQSLVFQCGAFTFLVFLSLMHSCQGQSNVIGPSQPIVALIGEDIVLPCYLEPAMNAIEMTLEWARPDLDPRFVLVWRDGVELESKKHPSYKGRASLFTDELKHGNISLKLSKVKMDDEGRYKCFMPALFRDSAVQLVVGAVSSPVVQMTKSSSGVLECESEGWYPEPEVFWLDGDGHVLSAGPTETVRGADELYTVHSTVTVEKRHGNNFTCRVQQKDINKTRETHILVPDHFFLVPSTPSTPGTSSSHQAIIGSTVGCAALVAVLIGIFVVWKWRQNKFKNKRRSLEDGSEQSQEDKMITSKSDNIRLHHEMEGGGESEPLMAAREEESNADNRGEQKIKSQGEHKDLQFVAENETNQDQFMTKPEQTRDMDNAEGESLIQPIINEEVPQITTERETSRRQANNSSDKREEEQTMKPVTEDSGLPVVLDAEENNQQPLNLHNDQEEQREDETQQDPENDVDKTLHKKRGKEETEQGRRKERGSGSTRQKKKQENETEATQPETERQRVENKRPLQSEMQKSEESEGDEVEVKPQTGNGSQQLSEDKTENGSGAEHEGEKDGERNQSDTRRRTERTAENQEEKNNETLKAAAEDRVEDKLQSEKQEKIKMDKKMTDLKIQKGDCSQHLSKTEKQEGTVVELEDKKGKDGEEKQSETTRRTERTAESQKRDINEPEEKRDEREKKPPSVNTEVTKRPETTERKDQELQTEKQKETNSQRNQDEAKEQPERSTKQVTEESKERQEEGLKTHRGAHSGETQEKSEETEKQVRGGEGGQQQAVQQLDVKEETREQPEEPLSFNTVRGAERQEDLQEEDMEVDPEPDSYKTQRRFKKAGTGRHKPKAKPYEHQQKSARKKKLKDENEELKEMINKRLREDQNENHKESEEGSAMEQEPIDEPQGRDMNSQQQEPMET